MQVIPAVDILGGRVVRLREGRPGTGRVYGHDPVAAAAAMVDAGAPRLHVVDLDRALSTGGDNRRLAWSIIRSVPVPVQVGGGLRDPADIEEAWEHGASGVVVATSLFDGSGEALAARYGPQCRSGHLIPSLDARSGKVAVCGWAVSSDLGVKEALSLLTGWGFARLIYTDTGRDGLLSGPGHPESLLDSGMEVVIAGGVRGIDDLLALKEAGFAGAIVGRAIYDGKLDLRRAVELFERGSPRDSRSGPGGGNGEGQNARQT